MDTDATQSQLEKLLARRRGDRIVVLTGAGISAESGIPTFRGPEGYWQVGSVSYQSQEMATMATFERMPREVWRWYLFRRGVCRQAKPNAAHSALVTLGEALDRRFTLVTQNVDGLHRRAGSTAEQSCEVHGNIDLMRPIGSREVLPIPEDVPALGRDATLDDATWARLRHPTTGEATRPHVLWFDEYYDEALYRSDTAMAAAGRCDVLVVVGTSGAASLPVHAVSAAARRGSIIVDINPNQGPFSQITTQLPDGLWLPGEATLWVPRVVEALTR